MISRAYATRDEWRSLSAILSTGLAASLSGREIIFTLKVGYFWIFRHFCFTEVHGEFYDGFRMLSLVIIHIWLVKASDFVTCQSLLP